MERSVRYCVTGDGVRIAYCMEGEGPPLLMCPARMESFSLEHMSPELEAFLAHLGRGRKLIRYDTRGSGLSQRDVPDLSHAGLVRDLDAVAASTGLERFSLWASSLSGPRAIDYAARHGDQVERLVLHGTMGNGHDAVPQDALKAYASLARMDFPMWARAFAEVASNRKFPDLAPALGAMMAESTSGDTAAEFLLSGSVGADMSRVAAELTMPVLVLHGTEDMVVLPQHGYDLASRIPDVRFVALNGGASYFFLGDTGPLLDALEQFLPKPAVDPKELRRESGVQTVLFTDLVDHTAMMQRLGDRRGRDVLREHERVTRATLRTHGGTEIKTMGDGFMASFMSPTSAVECAIELQRAFAALPVSASLPEPLRVRVGVNAGEPIEEDGDLFGATVIMAARVAAQADEGEILIPEPVRHLLAGKGFVFADRGDCLLKGFEDAVRLFEVRWRE